MWGGKRPWCFSFFHPYCSANDKEYRSHLFLFGLESFSYLVQRLLSLTQAEVDYTQKFNLQTWHNFGTKMQGVSQLNKTGISH